MSGFPNAGGSYEREINWCPSGEGYPAYCPQPGNDPSYTHCCTRFFIGGSLAPSCCYLAISIWNIIAIIFGCIVLFALFTFFSCWFLPNCPLNRKMDSNRVQRVQQQNQAGIVHYEEEPFRH